WNVPLIEDDTYGDLAHQDLRPRTAKSFDRNGLVILYSSFSKILSPGYRIGWVVAGRFHEEVDRLKPARSMPRSIGRNLAEIAKGAPMAPSTCNHRSCSAQRSARAATSSTAPAFTVHALPLPQSSFRPSALSRSLPHGRTLYLEFSAHL